MMVLHDLQCAINGYRVDRVSIYTRHVFSHEHGVEDRRTESGELSIINFELSIANSPAQENGKRLLNDL